MIKKLKVKNSGIIKLQSYNDFPDGNLVIAESRKNIPFEIKRVYYITNLFNKKSERGFHAHKKLEQIIFKVILKKIKFWSFSFALFKLKKACPNIT